MAITASEKLVLQTARDLMDQYGLRDWSVELDGAKSRLGVCRYNLRTISFSKHWANQLPLEEMRLTILHEIAHALTPGAKHGPSWKAMVRSIGGVARASRVPSSLIDFNWNGVCPNGHESGRQKTPTRVLTCSRCSRRFDLRYLISWTKNGKPAPMPPKYNVELKRLKELNV